MRPYGGDAACRGAIHRARAVSGAIIGFSAAARAAALPQSLRDSVHVAFGSDSVKQSDALFFSVPPESEAALAATWKRMPDARSAAGVSVGGLYTPAAEPSQGGRSPPWGASK